VNLHVQLDRTDEKHLTKLGAIGQALQRLQDQKNYLAGAAAGLRQLLPASQAGSKPVSAKKTGYPGRPRKPTAVENMRILEIRR
jgi:hypothetical protein